MRGHYDDMLCQNNPVVSNHLSLLEPWVVVPDRNHCANMYDIIKMIIITIVCVANFSNSSNW